MGRAVERGQAQGLVEHARVDPLGGARLDDRDPLVAAGAELVVPTLADVALTVLVEGRLQERRAVVRGACRRT